MGGQAIIAGIGLWLLAGGGLLVVRLGINAGRRFREGRWLTGVVAALLALATFLLGALVGVDVIGFALFWDPPPWWVGDWVGAIVGAGIGLLGVAIGAYFAVKNTNGPRERAFAVAKSILYWMIIVLLLVGSVASIPGWLILFMLLMVIALGIGLFFGIRKSREVQFHLQEQSESSA